MGVIITIRNKFGYVIVGLIALAIIGFLIMDTTNSRTGIFNRTSNDAGSVNGDAISLQDYQQQINDGEQNIKQQNPEATITEDQRFSLTQQTWDNFVRKTVLGNQFDKLGIDVTSDEMVDMLQGQNPHPYVVQNFTNPQTGKFDPSFVSHFIENLDEDNPDQQMTSDDKKKKWQGFKDLIKEDRLSNKYFTLIRKAIYVPEWEAKKLYELQQAKVDFDYVVQPFTDIPDDQVKIADSDLKDYLSNHKAEFKQEESRTIEYVTFPLYPSKEDTAKTLEWITQETEKFKTAKSDSLFVKLYSDQGFDPSYLKREELNSVVADTFFKVDTGRYIGPYIDKGAFTVAKLVNRKMIPDSVRVRQIVWKLTNQKDYDEVKKPLADSLLKLIQDGKADFGQLAAQNSQDPSAKTNGGDIGFSKPNPKDPMNADLFYNHKQGDAFIVPPVTNNILRIVQITEAKPAKVAVKVAFLSKAIVPSGNTKDALFADANKFAATYGTDATFKNSSKQMSLRTSEPLTESSYRIGGIGIAREIVKWAYGAKKGDVSGIFKMDDKYVIAHLTSTKEKGYATVDDVRPELEALVRKEKKAEKLKAKIEGAKDLQTVASKSSKSVKNATGLSFGNTIVDNINEPKVPNAALGLKAGELSTALTGNIGVYVVQLKNITPAPAAQNLDMQRKIMAMNDQQRVQDQVFTVLKDAAKIKDERIAHGLF